MDAADADDSDVTAPAGTLATPRERTRPPGTGLHSRGGRASHSHPLSSNLLLGLVLALLAWPTSTQNLIVANGVGPSWRAAVTMATHYEFAYGTRAVFTFGPLGFLVSPELFYPSTTVLAFIFTLAFTTAIFSALVWSLRSRLPWPAAAVIAYVVGGASLLSARYFGTNVAVEDVLALVLMGCVVALSADTEHPSPSWLWVVLGGALGIFSLVKVSLGIAIGVALVITVVCLPARRWVAAGRIVVGAVPLFCLGWFGTGNGLGNLVAYARTSLDVIGGYGPAMALEDPARSYAYWWAALCVVVIALFALSHARALAWRPRIGVALVTLATLWFLFKEGFVRHDRHDLVFFVAVPLILAAFAPKLRSRMGWSRAWPAAGMLGLTVVALSIGGSVPAVTNQPVRAVRNFFDEATTLASSSRRAAIMARSRRSLSGYLAPTAPMVGAMRGNTTDVSPWQLTALWGNPGIVFDPLPVLQDYTAFTPSLDQLDTNFLRSRAAPRYILRQPVAIDTRNPAFEPPATQVAIECRYREVAISLVWQLLQRQPDRCGAPRPLTTVDTGLGHWVTVPSAPPGDMVVASFELPSDLWTKFESLLFKPPDVYMAANHGTEKWRFVAATGPEPHVLRTPTTLGYSSAFVPVQVRTLLLSVDGEGPSTSGVTITFSAVPMAKP